MNNLIAAITFSWMMPIQHVPVDYCAIYTREGDELVEIHRIVEGETEWKYEGKGIVFESSCSNKLGRSLMPSRVAPPEPPKLSIKEIN